MGTQTNMTKIAAGAGVLAGILYAMHKRKTIGMTALFAIIGGISAGALASFITENTSGNDQQ